MTAPVTFITPEAEARAMTPTQPVRWHKAPNRMNDPRFTALGPLAQAALRNLDELTARGMAPVTGNQTVVCSSLGIEAKNARHVIKPLELSGLAVIEYVGKQMIVSLPPEVVQTLARPTPDGGQTTARPHKKTANDAGLPARSLIEIEEDKKENNPPNPLEGEQASAALEAAKAKADEKIATGMVYLNQVFPTELAEYVAQTIRSEGSSKDDPAGYFANIIGKIKGHFKKAPATVVHRAWEAARAKGAGIGYATTVVGSEVKRLLETSPTLFNAGQPAPKVTHPSQLWHQRQAGTLTITDAEILAACHEFRKTLRPNFIDATLDALQTAMEKRLNHATAV
jgi:hypothetical protein